MHRAEYEARVGTTLRGKWKLEQLIGVGGMAAVYVAHHKIGRDAAIKVLHPEIAVDSGVRERFEQEALAVNSIGHAGVVEVIDIDETDDGCPFLVMELLEGETLADRVARDVKPKLSYLLDMVDQLLDVLVACHKKGIIHRDIKPENLFIQTNGKLKVLDFGIARMREGVHTVAGTMLGTVAFMPPEQLKGLDVDARADIFAVGATMFTAIAGRRVHEVDDDSKLAMRALTSAAPPLASVAPDVPEGVAMAVDRALAYLADRRYPDAQTMRGDVWALQRNEKPPYARACIAADLDPHITKLPDKQPGKLRTTGELPATDPQLPAFAQAALPSTDPQLPAFAQAAADAASDAASKAAGVTRLEGGASANDTPSVAPSSANDTPSVAPSSAAPSSAAPSSAAPSSAAPPSDDVLDDGDDHTDKRWPAAPKKKPSAQRDSEPPESAPMSDPPPSAPPISAPGDVDAAAVARERARGGFPWLLLVVLLVAAGVAAAWWTGVIPGRQKSPPTPSALPPG